MTYGEMFEIKKEFILSEKDAAHLLERADFIDEHIFKDFYYDTAEYALSKNDMWLRSRSGEWELKIPKHKKSGNIDLQYQNIKGEGNLRQVFGVPTVKDFLGDIAEFGYFPFCECVVKRKRYKNETFIIDLDNVSCEDFTCLIVCIKLVVRDESEMESAGERMKIFAKSKGLTNSSTKGAVYEYIKHKKFRHYQALVASEATRECR